MEWVKKRSKTVDYVVIAIWVVMIVSIVHATPHVRL